MSKEKYDEFCNEDVPETHEVLNSQRVPIMHQSCWETIYAKQMWFVDNFCGRLGSLKYDTINGEIRYQKCSNCDKKSTIIEITISFKNNYYKRFIRY